MTAREPASIRYKNPGAMWGNALAVKWGAEKKAVKLNDGKGQGNNIAVFPSYVAGICAQLDLWRTSKNYRGKRFADAIATWSGRNEVESYIRFVLARVPGMTRNTIMDDAFWSSPKGIAFLKAQAWHEAGKKYPAPDKDWIEAQKRVFDGAPATYSPQTGTFKPVGEKVDVNAVIAGPQTVTKPAKTKITEGAAVGGGLSVAGIGATVWEKLSEAPDSILQAIIGAASKPSFWFIAATLVVCGFIWWRRRSMKAA